MKSRFSAALLAAVMLLCLTTAFMIPPDDAFDEYSEALVVCSMLYGRRCAGLPGTGLLMPSGGEDEQSDVRRQAAAGEEPAQLELSEYPSQLGLQGYVFLLAARALPFLPIHRLLYGFRLLCAVASAAVFTALTLLLGRRYGPRLACVSFAVFFLSPWIRNFSANLYWVSFTWFVPMLLGLAVSPDAGKRDRPLLYVLAFASIAVKCACGYEYISTVMMGLIAAPLAELLTCTPERRKAVFLVILKLGLSALAAFGTVLLIHASVFGSGDIAAGLRGIWTQIALRRVGGTEYLEESAGGFESSVLGVLARYLCFRTGMDTVIIEGLPSFLFLPCAVCAAAAAILRRRRGTGAAWELPMFAISFLSTVSWLVLARNHSAVHTHLNYVLWYFGFVQMCLYELSFVLLPAGAYSLRKR